MTCSLNIQPRCVRVCVVCTCIDINASVCLYVLLPDDGREGIYIYTYIKRERERESKNKEEEYKKIKKKKKKTKRSKQVSRGALTVSDVVSKRSLLQPRKAQPPRRSSSGDGSPSIRLESMSTPLLYRYNTGPISYSLSLSFSFSFIPLLLHSLLLFVVFFLFSQLQVSFFILF